MAIKSLVGSMPALAAKTNPIGGSALLVGQESTGTVNVPGAAVGMSVLVCPDVYPGGGFPFSGYVSAADTVTVKVGAFLIGTPIATQYNVRVIP